MKTEKKNTTDKKALVLECIPYLLQWYDYNRRILPWREDPTPYHVWVSEIMLQQTRVEAVRGYYDRFLSRLKSICDLADAPEAELLKLWEGLGYYNRVRNMQKAAQVLVEEYDGRMPKDYDQIRKLPGIGDYTAGAIASIAYGLPYPAVDGNVLRVMSRITCSREDIARESTKKEWRELLTEVIPERSGDFNQALMDLGATICLPNGKPQCENCPVMHLCRAYHEGQETELPVKAPKKERKVEKKTVLLIAYGQEVLLHRRPNKGLLAGLWEYPNSNKKKEEVVKQLLAELPDKMLVRKGTDRQTHIFSHVEWKMEGIRLQVSKEWCSRENTTGDTAEELKKKIVAAVQHAVSADSDDTEEAWAFVGPKEREVNYPMPTAFDKFQV